MSQVQLGPVTHLSPSDVQNLWISNGGDPSQALTAAAIVFSSENPAGNAGLVNDTAATGDYSVGLWQINYFGNLEAAQTARFGAPQDLAADPNLQAKAVIAMSSNGTNWQPWGPDFGYSGYGQTISTPLPNSRVGKWLAANGGASPSSVSIPPQAAPIALVAAIGFLVVATVSLIDPTVLPKWARIPLPI